MFSLVEQHRGPGYEQILILCIQKEFTQHHNTKIQSCCSKSDSLIILLMQPVVFFFTYMFLRSLPVKSQNSIILIVQQLQPVMIISELSSKASRYRYFLQAQVQVLLAVSITQAICIPGETDRWANQLMNGQVCLAAFMQQQQRLCCLHYYSWATLSKKKRKRGPKQGKQGKLKQRWG